nr:DNA polymerase III subunit beta [Mesorhizobium sp.]
MVSFKAPRSTLLPALALAKNAAAKRTTIPILSNLLVDVSAGRATIVGTDLDAELSSSIDVANEGSGAFTVPAAILHDAVRKLPDGVEVQISATDRNATVVSGRSRFTLPLLPAGDFPRLSAGSLDHGFTLAAEMVRKIVDRIGFAVSTEATRVYLNGIFFEEHGGAVHAVATDGHRLARLTLPHVSGADGMASIIVPREALPLVSTLAEGKGDVRIDLSETKISFECAGRALVSKLVDGTFPDYRRVIPTGNANVFTLDRAAFAAALDRVMTMGPAKGSAVRAAFNDGALKISTRNQESGEAEDEIECIQDEGDAVEIGFSGRYALDILSAVDCENVRIKLGDAGSPILVEPVGDDDTLFVLMPMRV